MKKIATLTIALSFCTSAFSQVMIGQPNRVIITPEIISAPVIYPAPLPTSGIIITPSMISGHSFYPTPYPYIYPQPWPFNQGFYPNPYPKPYPYPSPYPKPYPHPTPNPKPPMPPKPTPKPQNNIGYCLNNSCPINNNKHHQNIGSSNLGTQPNNTKSNQ